MEMNRQQHLLTVIYGYISLAIIAIVIDIFAFHPYGNILAGIWLVVACWYIGKYGELPKK